MNRPMRWTLAAAIALTSAGCLSSEASVQWPFARPHSFVLVAVESPDGNQYTVLSRGEELLLAREGLRLTAAAFTSELPSGMALGPAESTRNGCKLPPASEIFQFDGSGWSETQQLGPLESFERPCPPDPCAVLDGKILALEENGKATLVAALDDQRALIVNFARTSSQSEPFSTAYLFEAPSSLRAIGPALAIRHSAVRGRSVFVITETADSVGPTYKLDLDAIRDAIDAGAAWPEPTLVAAPLTYMEGLAASPEGQREEVYSVNGLGSVYKLEAGGWTMLRAGSSPEWHEWALAWLEPGVVAAAAIDVGGPVQRVSAGGREVISVPKPSTAAISLLSRVPELGPVVATFHESRSEVFLLPSLERLWEYTSPTPGDFQRFSAVATLNGQAIAVGSQLILEFVQSLPPAGAEASCPRMALSQGQAWRRVLPLAGGFLLAGVGYTNNLRSKIAFVHATAP